MHKLTLRRRLTAIRTVGLALGVAAILPQVATAGRVPSALDHPQPSCAAGDLASGPAASRQPVPAQRTPAPRPTVDGKRFLPRAISVWAPEYTSHLPLPAYDTAVTLAADGDSLWLATETEVARFSGGVWREPREPPGITKIFALAPAGGELWAFGFEGGAWHLRAGSWVARPAPSTGDLYAAAARGPGDVWAVGFDYSSENGVLLHWDGASLSSVDLGLNESLLYSIALDPTTDELWSGGCTYDDTLVLLRDGGAGQWRAEQAPEVAGCVHSLSFGSDGTGLAAAGSDLLRWTGGRWQRENVAPPDEYDWVRVVVAASDDNAGQPQDHRSVAWAIPGVPTWRGYTDGQIPWHYDGTTWQSATVDYRGLDALFLPTESNLEPRPFIDIAACAESVWSVNRYAGGLVTEGQAGLMQLRDGEATFSHPLMHYATEVAAPAGGSSARAEDSASIWVGGRTGAVTLLRNEQDEWLPASGPDFDQDRRAVVYALDFSLADVGWAVGAATDDPLGWQGPWERTSWRWDGSTWVTEPAPPIRLSAPRLRALPDGRAWLAGNSGQIYSFHDEEWSILKDAPPVVPLSTIQTQAGYRGTPFDFDLERPAAKGCYAARNGMYRYEDGTFRPVGRVPRGSIVDLQLTEGLDGWAIATDPAQGPPGKRDSGVLYAIEDCAATEVRLGLDTGQGWIGFAADDAEWRQMSAPSAREVWLWGSLKSAGTGRSFLLRGRALDRRTVRVVDINHCPELHAMTAVPVDRGTDVWILGSHACGPDPEGQRSAEYSGPVSRLRVRTPTDWLYLPHLAGPAEASPNLR